MNKTIFITGASSGIGKATAKLFAAKGWQVIATMRKPENETELTQLANLTLLPLDVTNVEQIKDATQKALALGPVDVVFNNAGYTLLGPWKLPLMSNWCTRWKPIFWGWCASPKPLFRLSGLAERACLLPLAPQPG
jgi:NAD(P)-dependent dehydrogenase (short-subunit alcohol dehydrogenase family)